MRKLLKLIFVSVTICIIISSNIFIFAENNEKVYIKEEKRIIKNLGNSLTLTPKTENVNLDYLYQMIQYDKASIEISKNLLNNGGENKEVAQIAKNIIKNKTISIVNMENLMESLIENLTQDKISEEEYLKEYDQIIKVMMNNFKNLKPTGNVDKDFLQSIMVHYQGFICISNSVIKYTDNTKIKIIAQELKNAQVEVEDIKKIFNNIK